MNMFCKGVRWLKRAVLQRELPLQELFQGNHGIVVPMVVPQYHIRHAAIGADALMVQPLHFPQPFFRQ